MITGTVMDRELLVLVLYVAVAVCALILVVVEVFATKDKRDKKK
jgi:cell division protein FtsL